MIPKTKRLGRFVMMAAALACLTQGIFVSVAAADPSNTETSAADRWNHLTPEERTKLLDNYHKWHALPPEQRRALKERWQKFQSLPPERKERIRAQWQHFQSLPPDQQEKIRANWKKWQAMTPEERSQVVLQHDQNAAKQSPPRPRKAPAPRRHLP